MHCYKSTSAKMKDELVWKSFNFRFQHLKTSSWMNTIAWVQKSWAVLLVYATLFSYIIQESLQNAQSSHLVTHKKMSSFFLPSEILFWEWLKTIYEMEKHTLLFFSISQFHRLSGHKSNQENHCQQKSNLVENGMK